MLQKPVRLSVKFAALAMESRACRSSTFHCGRFDAKLRRMHPVSVGRRLGSRAFLVGLTAASLLASAGHADGQPGQSFPMFTAMDLVAKPHRTSEFVGRVTMVVAITDRDAGEAMRAWYTAADAHVPGTVARKSIISLHIPFFITTAYARDQARSQVPEQFWDDTLLDRGDMAETLHLAESKLPYVYVLDATGKVVAEAHASARSPEAQHIWAAFER